MRKGAKVAIYARTSETDRFPENQLREMRAFAESRGWIISQEYVDPESANDANSPALDDLMVAARSRQIDIVLVLRFERIARTLGPLVAMLHELQSLGVAFVSLGDAIDTTVPSGQVMQTMIAAMARVDARA